MKKAALKKVFEKASDVLTDLGKAAIIAGFASLLIRPINWLFGVGGIALGLILIAVGLYLTYHSETLGEDDNA
jgi:hypothetical protein